MIGSASYAQELPYHRDLQSWCGANIERSSEDPRYVRAECKGGAIVFAVIEEQGRVVAIQIQIDTRSAVDQQKAAIAHLSAITDVDPLPDLLIQKLGITAGGVEYRNGKGWAGRLERNSPQMATVSVAQGSSPVHPAFDW